MNLQEFHQLYTYQDWANERLLVMLDDAFGADMDLCQATDPRIRAIRATAVHMVAAQQVWRERWEGTSPTKMLDPQAFPTLRDLRRAFETEQARFWSYFKTLQSDEDLLRIVHSTSTTGEPRIYPLWQMMQHVITHSVYHRGQITARLIELGHEDKLLYTDLILFYQERNEMKTG